MQLRVLCGACFLFCIWPAVVGSLVLLALLGVSWWPLVVCYCAVCFLGLAPRLASCRVQVHESHLAIHKGVMFRSGMRLPLRFLSGCRVLRSPLGRMAGGCTMLLSYSGGAVLLIGIHEQDAAAFCTRFFHGGALW